MGDLFELKGLEKQYNRWFTSVLDYNYSDKLVKISMGFQTKIKKLGPAGSA